MVIISPDSTIIRWSKLFNGKNKVKMREAITFVTLDQTQPNRKDPSIDLVRGPGRWLLMRALELSTEKSTLQPVSIPRDVKRPSSM